MSQVAPATFPCDSSAVLKECLQQFLMAWNDLLFGFVFLDNVGGSTHVGSLQRL